MAMEVLEVKREAFDQGAVTWQTWNSNLTISATGSTFFWGDPGTTTASGTWGAWNGVYTTTGGSVMIYDSATGQATQVASGANYTYGGGTQWITWNSAYVEETEEQAAARQARYEEAQAIWEREREEREARETERVAKLEVANKRAQELLLSLLSPEQRATYEEHGWFEVRGSKGGRWRIRNKGQSGNVDLMPEIGEERDATFCAHPPGSLPNADAHLAQMLTLVTDEDSFRRTANVHYRRPGWADGQAA